MSSDILKVWLVSAYVTFGSWPVTARFDVTVAFVRPCTTREHQSAVGRCAWVSMAELRVFSLLRRTIRRGRISVVMILLCLWQCVMTA